MPPTGPAETHATTSLPSGRTHRIPSLVYAALLLGAGGIMVFPDRAQSIGPSAVLIGYLATGLTILGKVRALSGRDRAAWRLVGSGFVVAAAGILMVAATDVLAGPVPAFGPFDIFFILAYGLIITGFGILPHHAAGRAQRARVFLDSLIGALAIGAFMWVLVLDDLLQAFAGTTAWNRWAGSAYPIIDCGVLILVAIVISKRTAFRFDLRILMFGLGAIAQTIADIVFLRSGIGTTISGGAPNFQPFLAAGAKYYTGAVILDRQPGKRTYADRSANVWAMVAPYLASIALLVLLLTQIRSTAFDFHFATSLYATLAVGLLVVVRQMVAIRENRRLVEKQRSELVSSISHELRTPLTTIVGFLRLLADGHTELDGDERSEIIEIATQQARYLHQIVADLEPLKGRGPGDFALSVAVVPVAEVAARAIESVPAGQADISMDVEPGLAAKIDRRRIQQVLVNLMTNAVRYGGGAVLVEARGEGTSLVFEVHDDGQGVPKQWEEAIWSRFERGENRLNAVQPGSGIGLAVVAAIVKAHGGSTRCTRSERLGGACFRVVLPRRVAVSQSGARVEAPITSGA